ncbi:MAG: hypothetical protein QNJ36_05220 [Calothrix sp. MO_167.B42]|nr:hypothetical protein [Calothrix sp. MO_167.B42]
MKILYKKILNLELWHDYYIGQPNPPTLPATDYEISDMLALVPTANCQQVLQNLRWVFRPQPRGGNIFAYVKEVNPGDVNTDFQTQITVDRPYRLTFWLVVRDRYFANYTNLPLSPPPQQIYYFSNLSNNQGHALFLTQPLPVYAANTPYQLGQLVTYDDNTLEALRNHTSVNAIPDTSSWDFFPRSQYVSQGDSLPHQVLFRTYSIVGVNAGDRFSFTLVDANEQETFALEVTAPDNHTPGEAIATNLNFSEQIPGRYRLYLDGSQVDEFVIFDPMAASNVFGLVEIVLNPNLVPPAFSVLQFQNGDTLIQPKTYVIHFKNRATHWRYRYERPHGFTEDDLPDFELKDDKTYFSKRPRGLLRQPERLLTDGDDNLLPAPGVMLIKPETQIDPETQSGAIAIFSDIHL